MTHDHLRQANEARAVADAMRSLRQMLNRKLIYTEEIPADLVPAVQVVLVEGMEVIAALEQIAAQLAPGNKKGGP
jgi:hypothetical protein